MSKPIIGVTASNNLAFTVNNYCNAILRAGGEPVVMRAVIDNPSIDELDGVLLSGGGDINPARYGQGDAVHPKTYGIDDRRDAFEIDLARAAVARDLPLLGICRGFQVVNVAFGGALVQHVDGHEPDDNGSTYHDIMVSPDTKLAAALGASGPIRVNSRHHQAVRDADRAPHLVATAYSPDGLIEALEAPNARWCVAVQSHPERLEAGDAVDPRFAGLFSAFVQEAARRAIARVKTTAS